MRRTTRAGRADSSGGISLFPFLAVLICVMGSLIVLLVVLARNARLQAAAAARAAAAKADASLDEIKAQRDMFQWQAEGLRDSRAKTEEQLAQARLQLGGVEDHIRSLRNELDRLKAAWDELDRMAAGSSVQRAQVEAELARLNAQIAEAQKRLAEETKAAQDRQDSYAVIPYRGPHGTRRRPIYIECRSDAVVIQPEGIRFSDDDFEGPIGQGNPLAVAVRAIREYWAAQQGTPPDEADEPYPLLLVRPDGIAAYAAAREGLRSWASDFGYELVEQDWKLKYPPPDPELAKVVAREIQVARARQELLAEIAPRYAGGRRPTYRAGSRGIVREGGSPEDSGTPVRPKVFTFGPPGDGHGQTGPAGDGAGQAASGSAAGADQAGPPTREPGAVGPAGVTGGVAGRATPLGHGAAGGPSGDAPVGSGQDAAGGPAGEGTSGTSPEATAQGGGSPGATAVFGSQLDKPDPGGSASPRTSPGVKPPDEYVAGRSASQADRSGAARSTPLRPGEWQEKPPEPKGPKKEGLSAVERDNPRDRKNLAEVRGRNWGLPGATPASVPITRPIRVDCYADRLVVGPEGSGGRVVRLGPRTGESVDELVGAVWDHMDTWGIAGRGMYWRPVLSVHVAPGGEERFRELGAALDGSGLKIEQSR